MAPGVLPVPAPSRRLGGWTWYLLIRLIPRDPDRRWSDATLDGIIIAIGSAIALWTFVGRPLVHTGRFGEVTVVTALAYAAVDLLVLATLARMLFVTGRPARASALF